MQGGQLAAHASPQVASVQQQWAAEQMGVAKHVIAKQQQLHQCLQRNMLVRHSSPTTPLSEGWSLLKRRQETYSNSASKADAGCQHG